ncbi:hypothetical protein B296_00015645 [Ensete ventricosum]|uniref:Uncharacterized protein n=1 Tax=Ensete ventricosum TaxID=4639 RepID=A0A426ZM30_ENSVE|nr:hypothetical protein B296_00015645 [Ensete ventricosum]
MLPCSSGEGRTIDLSTDADWCVPHLTMFIERRARVSQGVQLVIASLINRQLCYENHGFEPRLKSVGQAETKVDMDWLRLKSTRQAETKVRIDWPRLESVALAETEDFLGWFSLSVDALEARKVVTAWVPRPETSRPIANPAIEKHVPIEVRPPTKKLKRSGDSIGPIKEASPAPTPKPRPAPEVPRGDGSCRKKEKGVAHPWAMRDLCRV